MIAGWQIFTYDKETDEWYYHDSHTNPKLLAEACNELGLLKQKVQIREIHTNERH